MGANVFNCAEKYRNTNFTILEIQESAVQLGKIFTEHKKLRNITFINTDVRHFNFSLKKYDLVFVDAVFLYLDSAETKLLLEKLIQSTLKMIVIVDFNYHIPLLRSTFRIRDGYIHDFKSILSETPCVVKTKILKSRFSGRWNLFGTIIEIVVSK